jgi:hypothetical protein
MKRETLKSAIWFSFDLGVQGDYEGLYAWLDGNEAIECGDSLAFLNYRYSGPLLDSLTSDLRKSVSITNRTRIYVIYRDRDSKKMKGTFILGGRRAAPWSGFAVAAGTPASEEA